ncbi:hypothetical protein OG948_59835 (plasmid) [Embleya sp. NBC_00888]|uniref:hypothetical protein n=1 Tax=Embleya sp. NBC_00888 TaxID=2975960 RepID=UPI002F9096BF|nr:hypothetical protein OG948_59835 [Embleya sp. NBC_00888]
MERRKVLFTSIEALTGDGERDALAAALLTAETREGERLGWDRQPTLWALHLPAMDIGVIELRVVPSRRWRGSEDRNPADVLAGWGLRQPVPESAPARRVADAPDGFAGIAFMYEAWSVPDAALDEAMEQSRAAGERLFHERDDRIEVRQIVAVDINGNGYLVVRRRGAGPVLKVTDALEPHHRIELSGDLIDPLHRLVDAVRVGAVHLG